MGAHYSINNGKQNLMQQINNLTHNRGVDVIFNTTPISAVAEGMQDYLSIQGKQVLYSSFYPNTPINLNPDFLHKNATKLIGTANSNPRDFIRSIAMVEHKIINLKPFVSKVYPFEKIKEAMEDSVRGDAYRIVITF